MIKVDTKKFYTIGTYLFGIVAIMNTASLVMTYKYLIPTQFISSLASNLFNYLLFAFFLHLKRSLPDIKDLAKDDEIPEIIKKYQTQ